MLNIKQTIVNGLAIFSMFFGSGNLVFPLQLGQVAAENWFTASIGLIISGVILPFIGFYVISKFEGDYYKFFGTAGKATQVFLPFICLSLLGSFAVVPRCITVSLGGFLTVIPDFPPIMFNAILSILILLLSLYKEHIIPLLGKVLTPFLLFSLGIFIIAGIFNLKNFAFKMEFSNGSQFLHSGITTGYQTMDLIAAFFFSSKVYQQLKKQNNSSNLRDQLVYSGTIGALFLGIIYICFIIISASLFEINRNIPAYEILNNSAVYLLGNYANYILCTAIILSCLTTAIALNSIYAEYLTAHLFYNRLSYSKTLILTTTIAFLISNYNFGGIAKFLTPVLEVVYPALITLTLSSLINFKNYYLNKIIFYITLLISLILKIVN